MITIQITTGEALDRLSVLSIKCGKIIDPKKSAMVGVQFNTLFKKVGAIKGVEDIYDQLRLVNAQLWDLENLVRNRPSDYGLLDQLRDYRKITKKNYRRAELKRQIDLVVGDKFGEVKEHV